MNYFVPLTVFERFSQHTLVKKISLFIIFTISINVFAQSEIKICSFNIKFIGNYEKRDNKALADYLKQYDVIVIQEMVSPPITGTYPSGKKFKVDKESKAFFEAMLDQGFDYILSKEDTGKGKRNNRNGSVTEWFIAFYKSDVVQNIDTFSDFIAEDRSANPNFTRVPHTFSFKSINGKIDFTLISVHLEAGKGKNPRKQRAKEFKAIENWINKNNSNEKDFIVLGDMNIENKAELNKVLFKGYQSLNADCKTTTHAKKKVSPYDHVFYSIDYTQTELKNNFKITNLITAMEKYWNPSNGAYPKNRPRLFEQYFSDHFPISFSLIPIRDDD